MPFLSLQDWLGPYTKASKRQESDIYEQIRKLTTVNSDAKDLYDLENLFKSQIYSKSTQSSSTLSSKSSLNSSFSSKDAPSKIEELFYKESHCKDVNFSHEDKENKVPSIKPIIVNKKTCAVHGKISSGSHSIASSPKPSPTPCKVHGHKSAVILKEVQEKETKKVLQIKSAPPAYRFPPQAHSRSLVNGQENQFVNLQSDDSESINGSDITSNAFSCPEFLTNLILPTDEPETEDILAAVGVQSAKGKIFFKSYIHYRLLKVLK